MKNQYAHFNHADWLEKNYHIQCSDLGRKVANIIGYIAGGLYNAPIKLENASWSNIFCVDVVWTGNLSSWDDWKLSKLFIRCNQELIRLSIEPCAPNRLRLLFHQRKSRSEGNNYSIHPDIETLVKIVNNDYEVEI